MMQLITVELCRQFQALLLFLYYTELQTALPSKKYFLLKLFPIYNTVIRVLLIDHNYVNFIVIL